MGIIRTFLTSPDSPNVPLNVDGTARPLDLPSVRNLGQTVINKESLPSLDYALYLVNTVKFHVSQTYHIFEEASFMRNLYSLYNDEPQPTDQQSRLAYIQYLVVMALGKALLNRNTSGSRHHTAPSGSEYFVQALELFPDVTGLYANPVMAVEICSAVALYMQSVDHRNSAYVYVSQGLSGTGTSMLLDRNRPDFFLAARTWPAFSPYSRLTPRSQRASGRVRQTTTPQRLVDPIRS